MPDLNPRQLRFVEAYLVCGSGAEAARRAGYTEGTALRAGPKLLQNPKIKAEIDAARAKQREKTEATLEDAVAELEEHIKAAAAARQYTAVASLSKLKYEMDGRYVQRMQMQVQTVDLTAALAEANARVAINGGVLQAIEPPDDQEPPTVDIFEE